MKEQLLKESESDRYSLGFINLRWGRNLQISICVFYCAVEVEGADNTDKEIKIYSCGRMREKVILRE